MPGRARARRGPPAAAPAGVARAALLAVLALGVLVWGAAPAHAAIGVGTDVLKIDVPQPLPAGGTYRLVRFDVVNTGTEAGDFGIVVVESSKPGKPVPAAWLSFKPAAFHLEPGQSAWVRTTLAVPADAEPGLYRVRLIGAPQSTTPGAGGSVGVGVGPTLTFSVVRSSPPQAAWHWLTRWMPWSGVGLLVLVVAIGVAAALVLARTRERRRGGAEGPPGEPGETETGGRPREGGGETTVDEPVTTAREATRAEAAIAGGREVAAEAGAGEAPGAAVEEGPRATAGGFPAGSAVGVLRPDDTVDWVFDAGEPVPAPRRRVEWRTGAAVAAGTPGAAVRIPIVYGDGTVRDGVIGAAVIPADRLSADLPEGSRIKLGIRLDEARDPSVSAFIPASGDVFDDVLELGERAAFPAGRPGPAPAAAPAAGHPDEPPEDADR